MKRRKETQRGFTLIELLVVVAIIGLLSSAVFATLSVAQGKARNTKRAELALQYMKALELAQNDLGGYPLPTDGSWVCVGDYDGTTCPFGADTYGESSSFATAISRHLTVPFIRAGEILAAGDERYAQIISCKDPYGSICTGYDLRYQLEGQNACAGYVISESGTATFCQHLECPGEVAFDPSREVYDCQ